MNYTHKAIYCVWTNPKHGEAKKVLRYGLFEGGACTDVSPMQWRKSRLPDLTDEPTFSDMFNMLYAELQKRCFRNLVEWNAARRNGEPETWRGKYELLNRFA